MKALLAAVRAAFAAVPQAAPFLADWSESGVSRVLEPVQLPVCRWLEGMEARGVVGAIRAASMRLQWRQTYGAADFGAGFLDEYGWSEFVGLRGPVASERIACGVLLLGPGVIYPAHAHAAEEVYLPISGVAEWQRGDAGFASVPVGQAVHHAPWMPHAMRVGAEPLAALYLWRGGDLAAKSVILGR
ncbi:MAG: dimethylsulfonioproprionate lyase family protein [bacterium]